GQLALSQDAYLLAPALEFGGWPQAEQVPDRGVVMERRGLIVEHDVVAHGQSHEKIDASRRQQDLQVLAIILVRVGMVRVTGVAAHGDAVQLATEVVLEAGPRDLASVIEIFGPDEAYDGVQHEGTEMAGETIAARFQGLLVGAAVRVGRQRRALPG